MWRVLADGAMLEVQLGHLELPNGSSKEQTTTGIFREGAIIKALADGFVERYDAGEDYARSIVERVEDSGETDEGGNPVYVAVGAPESASAEVDPDVLKRAEDAEKANADLRSQVTELEGQVSSSQSDLGEAQARVQELEGKLESLQEDLEKAEEAATSALTYDSLSAQALEAEVAARGLTVTGTGANGNVLKKDNVQALTEADAAS